MLEFWIGACIGIAVWEGLGRAWKYKPPAPPKATDPEKFHRDSEILVGYQPVPYSLGQRLPPPRWPGNSHYLTDWEHIEVVRQVSKPCPNIFVAVDTYCDMVDEYSLDAEQKRMFLLLVLEAESKPFLNQLSPEHRDVLFDEVRPKQEAQDV